MTNFKLAAGAAGALAIALAASAAFAARNEGGYACQTWSPAKMSPAVTHCVTWTRIAAARMRAAPCDPAKMTNGAAMRAECAALTAAPATSAPAPTAG